jgi:hypothetical protein
MLIRIIYLGMKFGWFLSITAWVIDKTKKTVFFLIFVSAILYLWKQINDNGM